jgi:hypothetical protein
MGYYMFICIEIFDGYVVEVEFINELFLKFCYEISFKKGEKV